MAFRDDADKNAKAGLTRVMVSRADEDTEEIKDAYAQAARGQARRRGGQEHPRPLQGRAARHDRQVMETKGDVAASATRE